MQVKEILSWKILQDRNKSLSRQSIYPIGKLSLENYIMWETESSYIVLTLSVDSEYRDTVYFGIEYTGKNYNMEDAVMDLL